jgi:hypothetical protein
MPQPALFNLNKESQKNRLETRKNIWNRNMVFKLIFFAMISILLYGCGQEVWPNRQAATVNGIRIDSLNFLPAKTRYVLRDSATKILVKGYHTGYGSRPGHTCTEILDLGIEPVPGRTPLVYQPRSKIRLPADPDCPLETKGRDTTLTYTFSAGPDTTIQLLNPSGAIVDSAKLVKGRFSTDSLVGVPGGLARTITQGRWMYVDTSGLVKRQLRSDSLTSCEYLNFGTYSKIKDTIKVSISWVTLDSTTVIDTCHGKRSEFILLD